MCKAYFAAFIPAIEGGYCIFFPDFPIIASQGDDLAECLHMSSDALKLVVEEIAADREELPPPSDFEQALAAMHKMLLEDDCKSFDRTRKPLLQLVQAPCIDDTPVRISVSIPRSALTDIDNAARARGLTRSGYLVKAALAYG